MGKVVIPSLSWRLVLLGVGLTSVIALGAGGLFYFQFGLVAAKKAWFIAFFIVVVLAVAFLGAKFLQKKSARYYYLGMVILLMQLASLLYLFLIPVFFMLPIGSFFWWVIILLAIAIFILNAHLARRHFLKLWAMVDSDLTVLVRGVRGVSVRKFADIPDMSNAPSSYNFEPHWLNVGLAAGGLIAMILGFNFRKVFPEASMFAIGCAVVYAGGYFLQGLVVLFYKIRIIGDLEKKHGHPLVAMDFAD